jgi:Zn-dependent peptidase ImmA (M78 family)
MSVANRRDSAWDGLAARPEIHVKHRDLTAHGIRGLCEPMPNGEWLIILCTSLDRIGRGAVLAHELAHIDRGGGADLDGMPETWRAVVARDEARADRAAAALLVPADRLAAWLVARDEGVTADDIAEEWQVTDWIAKKTLTK